jgi:dihydrofolate reductase
MGKLIYSAIASLDGYIEDDDGSFGWAAPDEEVHGFVNDVARAVGTHLYGRRLYETMAPWETNPSLGEHSPATRDFAEIWQAAQKIVYSRTLEAVSTSRTRIERDFNPDAVRELKVSADSDLLIGGAELAAEAFRAGLVDECQLFLTPVLVGGGKKALPDGVRLDLGLLDERRFAGGTIFVRYRVVGG